MEERVEQALRDLSEEELVQIINEVAGVDDKIFDDLSEIADDFREVANYVANGEWYDSDYFTFDGCGVYSVDPYDKIDYYLDDIVEEVKDGTVFGIEAIDELSAEYEEVDVCLKKWEVEQIAQMYNHYNTLRMTFVSSLTDEMQNNIMAVSTILDKLGA